MPMILSKAILGLKHRGIQVVLVVATYLLLADHLPLIAHQGLYTISVCIKDLLMWVLPITVGLFIAHTISSFQRKAPLFIGVLILFEGCSNLLSVWYAYAGGHLATDFLQAFTLPAATSDFSVLWRLPLIKPEWWSANKGTLIGLALGCVCIVSKKAVIKQTIEGWKDRAQWMLTAIFSRLIPLFILGFVARMYQTQMLQHMFAHYGMLLVWLVLFLCAYILLLFFAGSGFSSNGFLRSVKNLLPAGGIAFTSGFIASPSW